MTMMQQATARTTERDAFYDRNGVFKIASLLEQLEGSLTGRLGTRRRNSQRYLKTFGLITMVGASATLAMPMDKAQARGDFSLSCTNIQLNAVDFSKTAMLRADCKTKDQGDPTKAVQEGASINLNDVRTINHGRLQWARRPGGGDFQEGFLRNPFARGGHNEPVAMCNGELETLDLDGNITNDNGN